MVSFGDSDSVIVLYMYHIHHTRGLILSSVPIGEANKFYRIFTKDAGLVGATAQAVREAKSKLRYTLQDFSWVDLDLVRGKDVWRITSAIEAESGTRSVECRDLFARVCALVSRLLHGEGRHDDLFAELRALNDFLRSERLSEAQSASLETLAALRILTHLGYFDQKGYEDYVGGEGEWSRALLDTFESVRAVATQDVNRALKETHL